VLLWSAPVAQLDRALASETNCVDDTPRKFAEFPRVFFILMLAREGL
jgi:hypothetical protein